MKNEISRSVLPDLRGRIATTMEYVYTYGNHTRLYLNVTNRCSNACDFCVRHSTDGLGGAILQGNDEPEFDDLLKAIELKGGITAFSEYIWCGFGEPTYRLPLILSLSPILKRSGARVRLNTNGHANLINGRDCLPELGAVLDDISISLNAPNKERYIQLSRPVTSSIPGPGSESLTPGNFWEAMIDFLSRASSYISGTQASVVGFSLSDQEIAASAALAESLGVTFRVR